LFNQLRLESLEDRLAPATFGLDVSSFQGTIDWSTVRGANGGQAFAIIRATEGTSFDDASFATNAAEASAAGLVVGAYHFANPDADSQLAASPSDTASLLADADAEADHFSGIAGTYLRAGRLQPALDLEDEGAMGASTTILLSRRSPHGQQSGSQNSSGTFPAYS
jgi:lysozyme